MYGNESFVDYFGIKKVFDSRTTKDLQICLFHILGSMIKCKAPLPSLVMSLRSIVNQRQNVNTSLDKSIY
jgi:hypothetical protein